MADQSKIIAGGSIAAGIILLWSALNNKGVLSTTRDLVAGKKPVPGPAGTQTVNAGMTQAGGGSTGLPYGTVGTSGSDAGNRALGKLMAAAYGWSSGPDWAALDNGWGNLESAWSNDVYNGDVHGGPYQPGKAYGIPQAVGHGSNGAPYPDGNLGNPPGAGGVSLASAQIAWGLSYIRQTYGSPSQVPGWAAGGGGYSGY